MLKHGNKVPTHPHWTSPPRMMLLALMLVLFVFGIIRSPSSALAAPSNDNCANATFVSIPSTTAGFTTGASTDGSSSCDGPAFLPGDVWFKILTSTTGFYSFEVVPTFGTLPTVLSIHAGCPGTTADEIACDDPTDGTQKLTLFLAGDNIYSIRVAQFDEPENAFDLIVNAVAGPSNDDCANATFVSIPSTTPGDTTGATNDGSASCDRIGPSAPPDVWFEVLTSVSGFYRVQVVLATGGIPQTVLSVHTGCPGTAANQIGCDDPTNGTVKLDLFLEGDHIFPIRVADFTGPDNPFILVISALAGPDISVSPLSLSFPSKITTGGPTPFQTVTIGNTGDADLAISSVGITGANPADFIITFDSGPSTLPPGGTRTLRVVFDPNDPPGAKSANLSILSNDPDEQSVNVALTGTGLAVPPQRFGYYPANDRGRGHAYFIDKSPAFGVQSYKIELRRIDMTSVIFHQAIINLAGPPTGDVVGSTEFDLPRIIPAIPTSYEADLQYRFASYDGLNTTGNLLFQSAFAFGSHPSADVTASVFNNPPVTASSESFTLTDARPTGPIGYPTGNPTAGFTYEIVSQNQSTGMQTILGQLDHGYLGSFATTAVHPATQRTRNVNVPHGNQIIYVRVRRTYISGEGSVLGKFEVAHRSPLLYFNIP